jgi:hypothetical protein
MWLLANYASARVVGGWLSVANMGTILHVTQPPAGRLTGDARNQREAKLIS